MSERKIIGQRYERLDIIGMGGMGAVYRGKDVTTDEWVAIKELRPESVQRDPDSVARFEREGKALGTLNHPNIVNVLHTAQDDENHYIVMQYVEGGSLREKLDEQPQLPVNEVLNLALDLTDALTRAHRLDIIHRDIKPANVLLNKDGVPLLTDFGVARIGGTSHMTATGTVMGTLAYLPPEALSGERIDTRADIWAFGIMLYEMVAGRRPFVGESTADILRAILYEPVPDIFQFRDYEELPWSLVGLIYWMLEKDRDKRPDSVRVVGALLENILSGKEMPMNWFGDTSGLYDEAPITASQSVAEREAAGTPTNRFDAGELDAEIAADRAIETAIEISTAASDDEWRADPTISRSDWSIQLKRKLNRPPRIFISYRRTDSVGTTGRIYDRLVLAFGEENVFKDVDNIPLGMDFKKVLKQQVTSADVLLIIIGTRWLNAADEHGRRLENPDDFVRIEAESGLAREDLLVIPVLVDGAEMPESRLLPQNLRSLVYRNSAVVRPDPDFNRDVEWLINQIHNSFELERSPRRLSPQAVGILVGALLLLALLLVGAAGMGALLSGGAERPLLAQVEVEPAPEGRWLVLVAQPQALGVPDEEAQQVQTQIVSELQPHFNPIDFAAISVRALPVVITRAEEAQTAAEQQGAAAILWGSYNGDFAQIELQAGSVDNYPGSVFSQEQLNDFANARYRVERPQEETLAFGVIAVINAGLTYANNTEAVARNIITAELIQTEPAAVQGSTSAAQFHRFVSLYTSDTAAGIAFLDQALRIDARHPGLYLSRALGFLRLQEVDAMRDDINAVRSFSPENWVLPDMILSNEAVYLNSDFDEGIAFMDRVVESAPEDWFYRGLRGALHYLQGDYEAAQPDIDVSLANDPQVNFPYTVAIGLALRDGRFQEAQRLFREVQERFPNPSMTEQMITATLSNTAGDTVLIPYFSAFGNLTLQRWNAALDDVQAALAYDENITSDLYFMQGFAQCNLDDHQAAAESYSAGIDLDPDYMLLYLLRAEAYRNLGRPADALSDLGTIATSEQAEVYAPILENPLQLNCTNFLEVDFTALGAEATPEPDAE